MFDAAGVPYPSNDWTMDDFVNTAEKLTVIKDVKWFSMGRMAWDLSAAGGPYRRSGDPIYQDGKLVLGQGAIKFLNTQKMLVDKKIVPAPSS
jgi:multiple sugar transport system substrate-binding protein